MLTLKLQRVILMECLKCLDTQPIFFHTKTPPMFNKAPQLQLLQALLRPLMVDPLVDIKSDDC
jgi:hypothetical protein